MSSAAGGGGVGGGKGLPPTRGIGSGADLLQEGMAHCDSGAGVAASVAADRQLPAAPPAVWRASSVSASKERWKRHLILSLIVAK